MAHSQITKNYDILLLSRSIYKSLVILPPTPPYTTIHMRENIIILVTPPHHIKGCQLLVQHPRHGLVVASQCSVKRNAFR